MRSLLRATGAEACRECGERARAERDRLEAENARLRDVESENASLRGAAQGLGELCDKYKAENAKLRAVVATAIQVQTALCGDGSIAYCRELCPLYRLETDDCAACDVIEVAYELGIEV